MNNDPFWGFGTIREVMRKPGYGSGLLLLPGGVLVAVLGAVFSAPAVLAIGIVTTLVGGWTAMNRRRSNRLAGRLEEHARREDAIVAAATELPMSGTVDAIGCRPRLVALVAEDRKAAEVARQVCLHRSAEYPDEADAWLDAASEIAEALRLAESPSPVAPG